MAGEADVLPQGEPGTADPASKRCRATDSSTRSSNATLAPPVRDAKSCVPT
jgi:hypothetical protein